MADERKKLELELELLELEEQELALSSSSEQAATRRAATKDDDFDLEAYKERSRALNTPQDSFYELAKEGAYSAIPVVGGVAGSIAGAVGGPLGVAGGGTAGYAAGKQLEKLARSYIEGTPMPEITPSSVASDVAEGLVGEATGFVGGKVLGAIGRNLLPGTKKYAASQAVKHLRPTPTTARILGQEKLEKVGQQLLDDDVIKFGAKAGDTLDAVSALKKRSGEQIGGFIKKASDEGVTLDPFEITTRWREEIIEPLAEVSETAPLAEQLRTKSYNFLRQYGAIDAAGNLNPNVRITPLQAEAEKKAMQASINYLTDAKVKSSASKGLARVLKEQTEKAIKDPGFITAKENFGTLAAAEKMLGRTAGLTDGGTGLMGNLYDLGATNVSAHGLSSGNPLMAATLAGRAATRGRVRSSTAVAANRLAKFLENNPAAAGILASLTKQGHQYGRAGGMLGTSLASGLGEQSTEQEQVKRQVNTPEEVAFRLKQSPQGQKFLPLLEQAAQRGPESFTTMDFLLKQTEPDYQAAFEEEE